MAAHKYCFLPFLIDWLALCLIHVFSLLTHTCTFDHLFLINDTSLPFSPCYLYILSLLPSFQDPNMFWDFITLRPETTHQVSFLFSDRGIPNGHRHMNGYGSHTFKMVNKDGEPIYCKFHYKVLLWIHVVKAVMVVTSVGGGDDLYLFIDNDLYQFDLFQTGKGHHLLLLCISISPFPPPPPPLSLSLTHPSTCPNRPTRVSRTFQWMRPPSLLALTQTTPSGTSMRTSPTETM